jgi:nucleotide-binding universal stress UspA family protein
MIENMTKLLLCTNGDLHTRPALEYGVWLADITKQDVYLLGVVETRNDYRSVEELVADTADRLEQSGVPYSAKIEEGNAPRVIADYASEASYLTVVGPLGRPAWKRVVQGRSFRRIMQKIPTPILYVRKAHLKLERILLCMGGLGYAANMETVAIQLAGLAGASATLLHVVEPVTLAYPTSVEIQDKWQNILETDTPQGRNLKRAISVAQGAGLSAEFKVQRGNIVHEILEEAQRGNYDLVGMGSPYGTHSLRHLYMPNVTAEVAEVLDCPILTVR